MIIFCKLLSGIGHLLSSFIGFFSILILVSVVLSWVRPDPNNMLVRFIFGTTEPLFAFVRRKVKIPGPLDWSPMIAWAGLYLIAHVIGGSLIYYGNQCEVGSEATVVKESYEF